MRAKGPRNTQSSSWWMRSPSVLKKPTLRALLEKLDRGSSASITRPWAWLYSICTARWLVAASPAPEITCREATGTWLDEPCDHTKPESSHMPPEAYPVRHWAKGSVRAASICLLLAGPKKTMHASIRLAADSCVSSYAQYASVSPRDRP